MFSRLCGPAGSPLRNLALALAPLDADDLGASAGQLVRLRRGVRRARHHDHIVTVPARALHRMLESPCQGPSARPRVDARGEAPATIQSPTHLRFRRSGMHLLRCRPLSQIAGLGLGGLLVAVAMVGCSGDKSTVSPTAGATPTLSPRPSPSATSTPTPTRTLSPTPPGFNSTGSNVHAAVPTLHPDAAIAAVSLSRKRFRLPATVCWKPSAGMILLIRTRTVWRSVDHPSRSSSTPAATSSTISATSGATLSRGASGRSCCLL